MVRINLVYTRGGDNGRTALSTGKRVSKTCARIEALGVIDELNSHVGWTAVLAEKEKLRKLSRTLRSIENSLFDAGALISTPNPKVDPRVAESFKRQARIFENHIDQITGRLPPLDSFILPGSSELNARMHICRAVCRRAERQVLKMSSDAKALREVTIFLNRLSDLFFALARDYSRLARTKEVLWRPAKRCGKNPTSGT